MFYADLNTVCTVHIEHCTVYSVQIQEKVMIVNFVSDKNCVSIVYKNGLNKTIIC